MTERLKPGDECYIVENNMHIRPDTGRGGDACKIYRDAAVDAL